MSLNIRPICLLLSVLACWPLLLQAEPLRLGIAPYLSTRTLMVESAPLKNFLAQKLNEQVSVGTAANPGKFAQRMVRGDFDVALLAPHFARYMQQTYRYQVLVGVRSDFYALLLVPKDDPARNVADIKGRVLNLPHHLSLVALETERYLRQLGVDPARDLRQHFHSTDNNAVLALIGQRQGVTATSRAVFERMPAEIRGQLRILGSTASALSLVLVANPNLPPQRVAAIKAAVSEFPFSEAGLDYFQARGVNLVPVGDDDLKSYDGLLPLMSKDLREFLQ